MPLSDLIVDALVKWLYDQANGMPTDVEDLYLNAADALVELQAYWRGYEES